MAVPYHGTAHENSDVLSDFGLDTDFGFLDSQYLQSIINVQQSPRFESHDSTNFELQNHLHVDEAIPIPQLVESLRQEILQEQADNEADHLDDFHTWFYHGAANRQSKPKLSNLSQLQINTAISSPGWALVQEKEVDAAHNEQQQPLDMSWEDMSIMTDNLNQQHGLNGHSISAARDLSDDTGIRSFQEIRSLSDTALASCFDHPEVSFMSTSTTDGESKRAQHRRSMSCHSVDSSLEFKFSSTNQRIQQQNRLPGKQEGLAAADKATDVSDMLLDLESKLVASLKSKPASPRQLQQQLQGGEHTMNHPVMDAHTSTESQRSATPPPPSNSRRRRDSQTSLDSLRSVPSGNCSPVPGTGSGAGAGGASTGHWQTQLQQQQQQQTFNHEEPGIRLVNLLVGCADSVANKNFVMANSILRELSVMVSPYGNTIQRVASYFTYGLAAHMAGTGSGQNLYRALGINEPSFADTFEAFQVFCEVCPFIKFGEAATTQAVLEAFSREENVHFIDLGMAQGSQWRRLLQGLATRNGGPPKVIHLTGVQVKPNPRSTESRTNDDQHGKQLKEFAEKLHLNFSCELISIESLEKIQAWMLTRESGQAIAVNCSAKLHTLLHHQDSNDMCHNLHNNNNNNNNNNGAINHVLSIIHSLRPKLFSLLEQEANHNVPHFLPRFLEALHFYSAMFDSLDASFSRVSPERAKVEQLWLGQEIINILACEGRERVERHERLHQWRSRLIKAGFRSLPLSDLTVLQVKTFPTISYGTGFSVLDSRARGSMVLSWQDRPLFSCSMWTC